MKTFKDYLSLNESGNIKVYFIAKKLFSLTGSYVLSHGKLPEIEFEIKLNGQKFILETTVSKGSVKNIQELQNHANDAKEIETLLLKLCETKLDISKPDFEKMNSSILKSLEKFNVKSTIIEK